MNTRRIGWSIVGVLSLSATARAGPVTWGFEGVVTLVEDRNNVLGGAVNVGSPLSGFYTFESTTPTISLGDGVYDNALTEIFGAVGGIAFTGPIGTFNRIYVFNGISTPDSYWLEAGVGFAGTNAFLQIVLGDRTGAMFQTNALPLVPPPLDLVDDNGVLLGTTDENLAINGTITRLFVVPEPGTIGLLATGLLFLQVRRRKHRHYQSREPRGLGGLSHIDQRPVFLGLVISSVLCAGTPTEAHDCNHNFVEDSSEIGVCPAFDLVFLLDSSISTGITTPTNRPPRTSPACRASVPGQSTWGHTKCRSKTSRRCRSPSSGDGSLIARQPPKRA